MSPLRRGGKKAKVTLTTVTLTGAVLDTVNGGHATATATFTVTSVSPPPPPPPPAGGPIIGATTGQGASNAHATPDLAGFQSFIAKTGTHPNCGKLFIPADGYPNLWSTWHGSIGEQFVAANGGHPYMPIIAFDNVPTAAQFQGLLSTLPAGQRLAFVFQSEVENGPAMPAATFLAGIHSVSQNLNTALAAMAAHPVAGNPASFYTRANFFNVSSAYMLYYGSNPGSTAFIPAVGDVDAYGADLYHKGSQTNDVCTSDPRFAGYVKAVHAKAGTNVAFAFPEWGIDLAGIGSEAARAALMKADYQAMTGPNAPGSKGLLLFNAWYEVGNSNQQYPWSMPSTTAQVWQQIAAGTM